MSWRRSREGGRVFKNGYRAVLCRWKSNDPSMMCKAVFIIIPTAPLKKKNQRLENDNTSLVWRRGGGVTLYVQSNIVYIHFISFSLFTDFRWRNDDPGVEFWSKFPFSSKENYPEKGKDPRHIQRCLRGSWPFGPCWPSPATRRPAPTRRRIIRKTLQHRTRYARRCLSLEGVLQLWATGCPLSFPMR